MSLLIKEVLVVDGEGKAPYKADVFVQKNMISAIGNLKGKSAEEVIDGLGNYLAPGFIDVNTDSDHYLSLFTNSRQSDFTGQGVTSIMGGQCGSSLTPLLYGSLESIRKWGNPSEVNVNWHTVKELLKSLDKISLGVNFGTLVGHSTVRRAITHGADRNLAMKEMWLFKKVLARALGEGAFGLSTGLGYLHGRNVPYEEIRDLVGVLKDYGAIYTTHLRNGTDKLKESVEEVLKTSKSSGVKTIVSHFLPVRGFEEQFEESLALIQASSSNVYFDIYPFASSVAPIYTLLPTWAQRGDLETMWRDIQDKEIVKKIVKEMKYLNPDDVEIAGAYGNENLVGKNLWQIMENNDSNPAEALLKVMSYTHLRATVFYKNINEAMLTELMKSDRALVGSNGNAVPDKKFLKHERAIKTFPKFLDIVVKDGNWPIEKAVIKITSLPASIYGLRGRGVVKTGRIADLVILGKNDYAVKETVVAGKKVNHNSKGEVLRFKKNNG